MEGLDLLAHPKELLGPRGHCCCLHLRNCGNMISNGVGGIYYRDKREVCLVEGPGDETL